MKLRYFFSIIFSSLLLGCGKEVRIDLPEKTATRTVLFYLAGDNDLSGEVVRQKNGLVSGWDSETMGTILVLSDVPNQSPTLEKLVTNRGKNQWETVKIYANEDSSSPELLRESIEDMKSVSSAESYGLVVFSHATGWLPEGAFADPLHWRPQTRSLIADHRREMALDDFVEALPNHLFDFIVFDMCFMAGVETTYALRQKTPVILGSSAEILSPGFSSIYPKSLAKLFKKEPDLKGFGQDFFAYFNQLSPPYRSATISLLRTEPMEELVQAVKALKPAPMSAEEMSTLQYFDRKEPHLFFDFADYLKVYATSSQMNDFQEIIDKIVIYKEHTPTLINIYINRHSGLSIYVPQQNLSLLNTLFLQTEWEKAIQENK